MVSATLELRSLADLRQYIQDVLCHYEQLLPGAFTITERILVRGNRTCGMYFCLHGPRAVKLSAIWETDRNTILFYGPGGERYHTTRLTATRQEESLAACA